MDMLSNWWGGKPATNSAKEESNKQVEKSGESKGDGDDVGAEIASVESHQNTDPAAAATDAAASATAGDSDHAETGGAGKDDTASTNLAEQTDDHADADVKSESKIPSVPRDLTKLTKEDAAIAAEAALNSAYNFGSFLFKKVSETATIIQKTVEEKTIVGDFQEEQKKFMKEKHSKRQEAALPPWVGYNEEQQMKEQILALSQDKRNFLRNPPAGVQFHFDYTSIHPIAMATLQEDPNLQKMRFELVPKKVIEENFWRNYFYRVSLIKQSSQLTSLAAKSGEEKRGSGSTSHSSDEGSSQKGDKTPPIVAPSAAASEPGKRTTDEEQLEMETPDSPPGSEFISDAFNSQLDEADLKKGMAQLGMDQKDGEATEEEVPEWEKELQQELQEYEVVGDEPNEEWEREINQMLEDEVDNES